MRICVNPRIRRLSAVYPSVHPSRTLANSRELSRTLANLCKSANLPNIRESAEHPSRIRLSVVYPLRIHPRIRLSVVYPSRTHPRIYRISPFMPRELLRTFANPSTTASVALVLMGGAHREREVRVNDKYDRRIVSGNHVGRLCKQ